MNTAAASCSIFESGLMVYDCIRSSESYSLDYFSLDTLDIAGFNSSGSLRTLADSARSVGPYDFWVFNWHFVTMAMLNPALIALLPGHKFTIVLELQAENPIGMVPANVFDGYIALDPAARATQSIFPFPRPLQGEPRRPRAAAREIPIIGSFGFGTPGKGFELLVEAVNREFDQATIRVNIPTGTHVFTDHIHRTSYPQYLAAMCKRIAKPGVDVEFSYDFMPADQLIDWCAANDLNCFMYTRCQPGLAATTDQAVMSGRPLLTVSNDTFRHIHGYIPAYPAMSLREAIATTPAAVRSLQEEWSKAAFKSAFHDMLAAFVLISGRDTSATRAGRARREPATVLVASKSGFSDVGILDYSTRLANALGRSGHVAIKRARCRDLLELRDCAQATQPAAVVVEGFGAVGEATALAAALESIAGPKIVLTEPTHAEVSNPELADGLDRMSREPIVPFYTFNVGLGLRPGILLVGFGAAESNLEEIIVRILREIPEGCDVLIEAPEGDRQRVAERGTAVLTAHGMRPNFKFSVASLCDKAEDIITVVGSHRLVIFWHDPRRGQELEDISSLALITERAVVFSRRAPFSCYGDTVTYVDFTSFENLMSLGIAAHIKTLHDYGEWQTAARIGKRLAALVEQEHAEYGTVESRQSARPSEAYLRAELANVRGGESHKGAIAHVI